MVKVGLLRENGSVVRDGFIRLKTFRLTVTHFSFVTVLEKKTTNILVSMSIRLTLSSVYLPSVGMSN